MTHKTVIIVVGTGEGDKPESLIPLALREQLIANWQASMAAEEVDHRPVVKLSVPMIGHTWLITEMKPDDQDILFGLCDLEMGFPELGYVSLGELASVRAKFGFGVERDAGFTASYPLSVYTKAASINGRIVEDDGLLKAAAEALADDDK